MSIARPDPSFLAPGRFIDSDHPSIVAFARETVGDATTDGEKARRLFRAVRERLRYDPYSISTSEQDHTASTILTKDRAYCTPKAVLLAAAARAAGLPSRVGFADVKNHLSSKKLLEHLGTDLFAYHGFTEIWVDGAPYKLTVAFNEALCERFGVPTLDFDPAHPADAVLQPFTGAGDRYTEYVQQRGLFTDLPFDEIMTAFRALYPAFAASVTPPAAHDDAFHG